MMTDQAGTDDRLICTLLPVGDPRRHPDGLVVARAMTSNGSTHIKPNNRPPMMFNPLTRKDGPMNTDDEARNARIRAELLTKLHFVFDMTARNVPEDDFEAAFHCLCAAVDATLDPPNRRETT
jgi:hypothetical protein